MRNVNYSLVTNQMINTPPTQMGEWTISQKTLQQEFKSSHNCNNHFGCILSFKTTSRWRLKNVLEEAVKANFSQQRPVNV